MGDSIRARVGLVMISETARFAADRAASEADKQRFLHISDLATCLLYPPKAELEARIKAHGYTLRYVEYCEDARTPGLLGQMRAVCDRERREVKISTRANPTEGEMLNILAHELRHLDEPGWDCGNRDVLGRGGPMA